MLVIGLFLLVVLLNRFAAQVIRRTAGERPADRAPTGAAGADAEVKRGKDRTRLTAEPDLSAATVHETEMTAEMCWTALDDLQVSRLLGRPTP
ncbi:hypothetical protein SAMN05892883_2907 [Jatrophihabitans sp. GAS493]|uniref:hypothetical protein n=1 Tax=Jatrophihabitans sp. GAS493 TaxID=1907575 RepID=UPI000BB8B15E|nr:hypothetical protein [Jatrophihabitans sp. GAS493]SOD73629.1 hypothetical protein SAMN05892883_2907 [Jatrophihabitans sp. GAS493]